tara:strand:- start:1759 stop:2628 length:870 start_codon:yes stop_codon:yes gene_type:complete
VVAKCGPLSTVREASGLRETISSWRSANYKIGLVPTMGALHEGHISLIRRSLSETDRTCVTLFVNPRQFGPSEDFSLYPRDELSDVKVLTDVGAHLLFAPEQAEMYPSDFATNVTISGLGDRLEGEFRPGFLAGVATVVAKLLIQAMPDVAYFGEKDYQQLLVIRQMVADLGIPVAIRAMPTVREADGLALSSRNSYLTPERRELAPILYRTLCKMVEGVVAGKQVKSLEQCAENELLEAGFDRIDYITIRDSQSLEQLNKVEKPSRALAAVWLGKTRLIDNISISDSV